MMQKAATLYDAGDDAGAAEAANMAKYAAGEASTRAVDQAVQSHGGNGLTKEYGIGRDAHRVAAGAHRPGQPGDDPQLRRADVAGSAAVVLMDALVSYAVDGHVARLTLDSPHNRNALSARLVEQLHDGLRDAAADPAVRVLVLGHTGGTFCAGADLSEASGGDPFETTARARPGVDRRAARDRGVTAAGGRGRRRSRPGRRHGPGRRLRHRGRRAAQHLRADRGADRRRPGDHLADAAAEDVGARGRPLLPDRRDVHRRAGRRDRSRHGGRRRPRRRRSPVCSPIWARARRRAWRRRRR